ncbi:MAG: hypothetical protein IPJ34_13470 [Myxococcales bacterium]|nr:hypothetical protein [Myxococcales bacterium]
MPGSDFGGGADGTADAETDGRGGAVASSTGIVTVLVCPSSFAVNFSSTVCLPGAEASTVWTPGSTAMATPNCSFVTTAPSRLITRSGVSLVTTMAILTRRFSRAADRSFAYFDRSACPTAFAASAAARKVVQALIVRPSFS